MKWYQTLAFSDPRMVGNRFFSSLSSSAMLKYGHIAVTGSTARDGYSGCKLNTSGFCLDLKASRENIQYRKSEAEYD